MTLMLLEFLHTMEKMKERESIPHHPLFLALTVDVSSFPGAQLGIKETLLLREELAAGFLF